MKILLLACLLSTGAAAANDDCADRSTYCVRGEPVVRTLGTADAVPRSAPMAAVDSHGVTHAAGEIRTRHSSVPEPAPSYAPYPLLRQTTLDDNGATAGCARDSTSMRCLPVDPNRTH